MKNLKVLLLSLSLLISFLYSCEKKTDVVDSGTYKGKIDKVEPEKTEIYVVTDDDKRLELYFTDATTLTKGGETVEFKELKEGGNVEVEVKKVGERLEPVSVVILE